MRIVVAGATGFVGAPLCAHLSSSGHEVIALCRNPQSASARLGSTATAVGWDGRSLGEWASVVDGADAIVNLCGEGIADKRWSDARKRDLIDSRLDSTKAIVQAIAQATQKPAVLVNASAIGWYGARGDEELDESAPAGEGFLPKLCADWEAAAREAETHCRVVMLRIGIVLGPDGGALGKMLLPFKLFFGGPLGSGQQQFSWVHRDDLIRLIEHAIATETLAGPVNATGPQPLPLKEFCKVLGGVMGRPSWAPVPAPVLKVAMGEMSEMLLTGQRVVPRAAMESGYVFKYPTAATALSAVVGN